MEQNTFAESQSQPAASSSSESRPEKTFTQGDLDAVAGRVRAEERSKYQSHNVQSVQPNHTSQVMPSNTMASNSNIEELIDKRTSEKLQQYMQDSEQKRINEMQTQEGMRIANDFISKVEAGKQDFPDYDSVVGQLPLVNMPHIVALARDVDNTAGVMYELAQNPTKIASLTQLMNLHPQLARNEMKKLSDSIKKNEEAKQQKQANEPLSRTQPSPVGIDNGTRSVRDFQKMFLGSK
jgi:hypothetical protein